jgi:drug/metabolite transporter (DMT)-like permease
VQVRPFKGGTKQVIWLTLALLSSATFAVVGVIDKRLIDKHLPSLSSYYVWIAISVLIYGFVFLVALLHE